MTAGQQRRTAFLLAICQACYLSASSIGVASSGLVGTELAPSLLLATLPYSLIATTNAAVTVPASFLMARLGRRAGFVLGALIGGLGGVVSAWAIFERDFLLFCLGNALWGAFQATAQYYRFAAADAAAPAFRSRAVSYVLAGGVAAALIGPEIATRSKDLFAPVLFAGSFLAISVLAICTILTLAFLDIPVPSRAERAQAGGRPFGEIARQPIFIAAVANGVIGYAIMSFVMTASPIAAVRCGLTSAAAAGQGAGTERVPDRGLLRPRLPRLRGRLRRIRLGRPQPRRHALPAALRGDHALVRAHPTRRSARPGMSALKIHASFDARPNGALARDEGISLCANNSPHPEQGS